MNYLELVKDTFTILVAHHISPYYAVLTYILLLVIFYFCWNFASKKVKTNNDAIWIGFLGVLVFEFLAFGYFFMGRLESYKERNICDQIVQIVPETIIIGGREFSRLSRSRSCQGSYEVITMENFKNPKKFELIEKVDIGEVYKDARVDDYMDVFLFVSGVERKDLAHLERYRLVQETNEARLGE